MHRPSLPAALRRPAPATVISLIALFFALSGTAVAATGGNFILGKSNTATSTTSLSNSNGTALSLTSTSTTPPLKVSNSVQVPNLNASKLGGHPSSAFLPVNGTAANANKLGGNGPNAYMFGTGQVSHTTQTLNFNFGAGVSLGGAGASFQFNCNSNSTSQFVLTAQNNNSQVWWLNKDGQGFAALNSGQSTSLTPASGSPYTVTVQVTWGSNVASWVLSMAVNTSAQTCTYTAQSVSDG